MVGSFQVQRRLDPALPASRSIEDTNMPHPLLRCSFCRKHHTAVAKLVAGPRRLLSGRVYICDRCATLSSQIMQAPVSSAEPAGAAPRD